MSHAHRPARRTVEVESLDELDALVARSGTTSMRGWVLQDLDLTGRTEVLRRLDPRGSLLLGCRYAPGVEEELRSRGALVFPSVPEVPFDPYRPGLYTPVELYAGRDAGYRATLDGRVYAWSRSAGNGVRTMLAQSLHDLSVDDALTEHVRGRRVVGVMGGHDLERGTQGYADAARLGRGLARAGLTVASGGGPGAMEAANLGAHLASYDDAVLGEALDVLARVPSFAPDVTAWVEAAFEVRKHWPGDADAAATLGVPTWFYGHEPPNAFAGSIAKYFKNAIREDVLLHVCTAGVVFLPGRGGTVQEVFQDACENYYATAGATAPMVLVGTSYWTEELPVWPLLQRLAAGREMAAAVHLVDDLDAVAGLLARD